MGPATVTLLRLPGRQNVLDWIMVVPPSRVHDAVPSMGSQAIVTTVPIPGKKLPGGDVPEC
jgi:hypothetical protein